MARRHSYPALPSKNSQSSQPLLSIFLLQSDFHLRLKTLSIQSPIKCSLQQLSATWRLTRILNSSSGLSQRIILTQKSKSTKRQSVSLKKRSRIWQSAKLMRSTCKSWFPSRDRTNFDFKMRSRTNGERRLSQSSTSCGEKSRAIIYKAWKLLQASNSNLKSMSSSSTYLTGRSQLLRKLTLKTLWLRSNPKKLSWQS